MGYDLHITRKQNWFDDAPDIADSEWRAYVDRDPEMNITGIAEANLHDGRKLRYENPLIAEWRKHSNGEIVWFDFRDGRIVVKNPDGEIIVKMQQIAAALRARVQGDDGEVYLPGGEIHLPHSDEPTQPPAPRYSPSAARLFFQWPLWKQLVAGFLLGCVLLALKILISG